MFGVSLSGRTLAVPGIVFAASAALVVREAPAHATAAGVPRCATAGLVVWLDNRADHAAGSTYYRLEFTNLASRLCQLRGYPGVSAVSLAGRELGSAAARNPAHPSRIVMLRRGASATAVLQITDTHNYPPAACRPVAAAGLRVYPPNEKASKVVPVPLPACAHTGVTYLHVEAVQ